MDRPSASRSAASQFDPGRRKSRLIFVIEITASRPIPVDTCRVRSDHDRMRPTMRCCSVLRNCLCVVIECYHGYRFVPNLMPHGGSAAEPLSAGGSLLVTLLPCLGPLSDATAPSLESYNKHQECGFGGSPYVAATDMSSPCALRGRKSRIVIQSASVGFGAARSARSIDRADCSRPRIALSGRSRERCQ